MYNINLKCCSSIYLLAFITIAKFQKFLPVLWDRLAHEVQWPSLEKWQQLRGNWEIMPNGVGVIDGTTHMIYVPSNEPQRLYYRRDKRCHVINTQVIIDNTNEIVFIQSGFLGRQNDAGAFSLMPQIGPNADLIFPEDCYLLADCGYANAYPLMTPYEQPALAEGPIRLMFNKAHKYHRASVEHVIGQLKSYTALNSRHWRHERWMLPVVCEICAALTNRRLRTFKFVRGRD